MADEAPKVGSLQDSLLASLGIVGVRLIAAIATARLALSIGRTGPWFTSGTTSLTGLFEQWDAGWYLGIAKMGYFTPDSRAFYPAYPLLIRLVSPLVGYSGGALAISWIAAVIAVWGVLDVARRFVSFQSAWTGAMLLAWNPVSIFFIAGYPESLLAAAMVWSLRFCLDKKWSQAAGLAAVASCLLPQGAVSALVVGFALLLSEKRWRGLLRGISYALIGELGLAGYMIYSWVTTGNPVIFESVAKSHWHVHLTYPFHSSLSSLAAGLARGDIPAISAVQLVNGFAGVLGGAIAVVGLRLCWRDRRLILPSTLLALGVLVSVITIEPSLASTARFVLFIVPLYVVVAVLVDRLPRRLKSLVAANLLILSALLSVLFGVMFNLGWWLT